MKYTEWLAELKGFKANDRLNTSDGNHKLVSNETTRFIIWNLPSVITCPYATEHCKQFCYAKKSEQIYPDCLPCRTKNFEESKRDDFVRNMTLTILSIAKNCKKKEIIVRIHESGDFYSQKYTDAWIQIMINCSGDKRIKFIAYTKSFKFFDEKKLPRNLALRASIWDDTKPEQLEIIERNGWNTYSAVDHFQVGDSFTRCRCSDCATCKKCWQNYKDIRCEIH